MKPASKRIVTIPNILSLFRLLLIPVIVWLYVVKKDYLLTLLAVILSGLTDIVDGFIARRFNMITEVGKILDPVADKLTQLAVALILSFRFKLMFVMCAVIVVKEIFVGICGLLVIKKTGIITGAKWHGKVATTLIYFTIGLHILLSDTISPVLLAVLILACVAFILFSLVSYAVLYIGMCVNADKEKREA